MSIIPVILSGGSGTRLWPLSREAYPKQFLHLTDDHSLFQATIKRLQGIAGVEFPMVVCNDQHRFVVAEQARAIGANLAGIVLEPVGRNTAPAVAAASLLAMEKNPEAVLLILPADHLIPDQVEFHRVIQQGLTYARSGHVVTFGIVPKNPETGFGYIHRGQISGEGPGFRIQRFVEKPDLEKARFYVDSGEYYWNSGMFMFAAKVMAAELDRFAPDIAKQVGLALSRSAKDLDFIRMDPDSFAESPNISIDYAVMEKTERGVVLPLDAGWSDVGSWAALWGVGTKDAADNVVIGDVLLHQVDRCYIRSESRLVAGVGVSDHVIIETADAVLVAARDSVQDVGNIVKRLQQLGRREHLNRQRVFRPWGSFKCLNIEDRFQVKRIRVNPGASLSLQMHHHRAEHWIVVRGTAQVTRGDESFLLTEDQSTYIPLGVRHRLANPGKIPLDIIEIQSGSYLGEDDIVRFDDSYGRSSD
ncbi:MAG: mannose-1-phosphate guanylyltransferase/mannose-6-phosphate isomerase [Magnetococcales bacterium]|nr:mannose-1-phosphate guanylyltransferase/mannose-6-phosphate isomerase [Magnetococcales bacterium]MBF0150508.1 mannose-1-phosphate guanylyltransferase/mannose-6-phosphate isomerase [Magnetococcales bacterium]MBF0172966.1 mannose-1-phosphate guanylyltransferase/mannose-6-phosphate isomerase [Magnetococcales bacterium]MBF0349304.1 mannose-1-phosphate guanylyltransferase/mannose-6-phosphate isomerase [Magnetococcales bacterium]MBF0631407.1 mannose-1-phosphate guanylyltransferase/mannose-6-phosph